MDITGSDECLDMSLERAVLGVAQTAESCWQGMSVLLLAWMQVRCLSHDRSVLPLVENKIRPEA